MDYTAQRSAPHHGAVTAIVILKGDRQAKSYIDQIIGIADMPMELTWGKWTAPEADNDPLFKPVPSYA